MTLALLMLFCAAPKIAAPPLSAAQTPVLVETLPRAVGYEQVAQAARLVEDKLPTAALAALGETQTPAAALVRARAQRLLGRLPEALVALQSARQAAVLAPLIALEDGRIASAQNDPNGTLRFLLPLLNAGGALAGETAAPLMSALTQGDPNDLLTYFSALAAVLPKDDIDARSLLLEAKASAHDKLGQAELARLSRLQRYLEEPVSTTTPGEPPAGPPPTPAEMLGRVEKLLEAHRNERALAALDKLADDGLAIDLQCRKHFAQGLASRKLRKYSQAEENLSWVTMQCQSDADLTRRAAFLRAKVISIRDGLRAIEPIEAFAKAYPSHSMTDDVLFWAGDLYQRRGKDAEAQSYYARIDALPLKDDHCAEARWRMAWMAYRRHDFPVAQAVLQRLLLNDGCAPDRHDQSRARYWLGRLAEEGHVPGQAIGAYQTIMDSDPLSFYAQQALPRLLALQKPSVAQTTRRAAMAPTGAPSLALCPDWLAAQPGYSRGLDYAQAGLLPDAAAEFRALEPPAQNVMGESHAAALGVAERAPTLRSLQSLSQCGPSQAALLLVLLLDRAGAQHDAHWRLRTEFGDEFSRFPTAKEMVVWRAAYPLAYRELIAPAEQESHLPTFFLQALAREESAFDTKVVSWAEAYGLTQLMLASGQAAGKRLLPQVIVRHPEELLDPGLNARLGGALLASLVKRFAGNLGLALAGYNAGEEVANAWWKRHAEQEFAIYAEEMTIQETRGYVKRVLRTYGIYRWLYAAGLPTLPIENTLPARP